MNFKRILRTALVLQLTSVYNAFAIATNYASSPEKNKEKHIFIDKNDDDVIKLGGVLATPSDPETSDISTKIKADFGLFSHFSYHGKNNRGKSVDKNLLEWFRNDGSLSSLYTDGINFLEKKTELSRLATKSINLSILLTKKINLFDDNPSIIVELTNNEQAIQFKKLYIKNSFLKFGKNDSIFESGTDPVWGGCFMKKFNNSISIKLGLEEFNTPEKIKHSTDDVDKVGSDDDYTFFTNTEKVSYSFVPKISYKNGNQRFSFTLAGIATCPKVRYENKLNEVVFYMPIYGVNLSAKIVLTKSDFLEKKDKNTIDLGAKYVEGMSRYITECDLPKYNAIDFKAESGNKFTTSKILAASLGFMHVWNDSLSSKLNLSGFYILNCDKGQTFEYRKKSLRWYDNAVAIKVLPLSYTINKVFTIEPSYVCKIGNPLMKSGFASGNTLKIINSAGIKLRCDVKVI